MKVIKINSTVFSHFIDIFSNLRKNTSSYYAHRLLKQLHSKSTENNMIEMYKSSDKIVQMLILSVTTLRKYTKEKLMHFFNCSKPKVDKACNFNKDLNFLKIFFYLKSILDKSLIQICLIIFSDGLLQNVA